MKACIFLLLLFEQMEHFFWIFHQVYLLDIILQILDEEAVEEVKKQREIPDIKPGYIIQLKVVSEVIVKRNIFLVSLFVSLLVRLSSVSFTCILCMSRKYLKIEGVFQHWKALL